MSAFRSLAPLNPQDQSSGSSPSKTGSNVGYSSTSGGASGGAGGGSGGGADGQRRRRTAGNVSQMACTECRHARQRCDGHRPDPCGRCLQRKLNCVYEPHTKTHKDDLLREIEVLRDDNTSLLDQNKEMAETAIGLEQRNKGLQETSDWQKIILDTIGSNGHDREIIIRLRAGESHQSIADWLSQLDTLSRDLQHVPESRRGLVDVVGRIKRRYQDEEGLDTINSVDAPPNILWTRVSSSETLIGHLLGLYFTWVHPFHMLFSEFNFKQDFQIHAEDYCSTPLVNAICAMACHLVESEIVDEIQGVEVSTLSEAFMNDARANLNPDNLHHMTSIQTFAVMYLVDLGSGKAQNATKYLRTAVDALKMNHRHQQSAEAVELSAWGIHSLNTTCTSMIYQPSHDATLPSTVIFQHVRMDREHDLWRFYRHVGDDRELPSRSSHAIMTACNHAKLLRIGQESLNLYCGTRGKATAEAILEGYRSYLDWKDNLPPAIKNIDINDQPLPHVLYLHVLYHAALVQHFTPLLHCNQFSEEDTARLCRLVLFHARTGVDILQHAHRLYSSRYQLPLVTFCSLHISDTLIRHAPDDPPASQTVQFCLETMQQSRLGFGICGPLQELFLRTAMKCNVDIRVDIDELMKPRQHFGVDDILDACTRLDYTLPIGQALHHIDPGVAQDWPYQWQRLILNPVEQARRPSLSEKFLQITSLLND
ncbi:hypothetical protein MMC07_006750 [Pseudocyphellaria aurata]|nr:hypothetical protein [Pseudocyphellaria aurata]